MFEKIQKGVYNLPLDISHSSSNLKAAHNFIKSGEVLIFRNAVNKNLVNSIKAHLIALGRSSYPNYHAISKTTPNFHRLNDEDERAFVKGRFQQFNYFPWNQDYFNFFKRFKFIFELKKRKIARTPSLNLSLSANNSTIDSTTSITQDIKTATLSISAPIYRGGSISAAERQAISELKREENTLEFPAERLLESILGIF